MPAHWQHVQLLHLLSDFEQDGSLVSPCIRPHDEPKDAPRPVPEIRPECVLLVTREAPHHLFEKSHVEGFQSRRSGRPLLIIDLAVPRDIHPEVSRVSGVHLVNIDDLQTIAETNLEGRRAWIPAAERIIDEELRRTRLALEARASAPTIRALVNRVEGLRDGVLERHLAQLPANDGQTREAMRKLADALTANFLHGPIRALRESPDSALEASVMNNAFDLDLDRELS